MKTFEEAYKIIQGSKDEDIAQFKANIDCEWENLKDDKNFQQIIRVSFDAIIMKMMQPDGSPTLAIMNGLVAIAQTFMLIGMEMEKE